MSYLTNIGGVGVKHISYTAPCYAHSTSIDQDLSGVQRSDHNDITYFLLIHGYLYMVMKYTTIMNINYRLYYTKYSLGMKKIAVLSQNYYKIKQEFTVPASKAGGVNDAQSSCQLHQ